MPKRHFTDNLRSVTPEEVAKTPVVSYFRVSTVGQGDKDKSGLDRQEEATHDRWFGKYEEYRLVENVTLEGIRGAKKGRFGWFLKGLEKSDPLALRMSAKTFSGSKSTREVQFSVPFA